MLGVSSLVPLGPYEKFPNRRYSPGTKRFRGRLVVPRRSPCGTQPLITDLSCIIKMQDGFSAKARIRRVGKNSTVEGNTSWARGQLRNDDRTANRPTEALACDGCRSVREVPVTV